MNILFKTSDGKVFTDHDKAVIHQKLLNLDDPTTMCRVSCDGGVNFDWEYGYPDGRGGWHRPIAKAEAELMIQISDVMHQIDGECEMDVAGAMPDGWLDPLFAKLNDLQDQLARLRGFKNYADEVDATAGRLPFDC